MNLNRLSNQAGARVVIHDVKEWPLIDEYGMDVDPATYTLAAITAVSDWAV